MTDFTSIRGQDHAKRALEVAASGGHSLALTGSPGNGKTLLACALLDILPSCAPLASGEQRQRHVIQGLDAMVWIAAALRGSEGEVRGFEHAVLLLERLDCFAYSSLQIQRLGMVLDRGDVQFVLTQHPCPCGYYGDPLWECTCTAPLIVRHQRRMRALMERVSLAVEIPCPDYEHQIDARSPESSATVSARVQQGAERQWARFAGMDITQNAEMDHAQILRLCVLDASAHKLFKAAHQHYHFSLRSTDSVLAVARTIADLADSEQIQANHIAEAVQYHHHMDQL